MPNPFPGMDPYLENPTDWQGFHNAMITHMAEAIQAVLPETYVAKVETRCLIERAEGTIPIKPDIAVVAPPSISVVPTAQRVAILERTAQSDPPLRLRVYQREYPVEERQAYLNILDRRGRQIVTAVEILSPTNKNTRDDGHAAYVAKQNQILASSANLLEIDLLRGGTHTVAVPLSLLPPDRLWAYLTCLHRGGQRYEYEVWPTRLQDPLPRIAIPLGENDPDIVFDLQALLTETYEANRYDLDLDYIAAPAPPLKPDDALWVDRLLRERGLR